MKFTDLFIRRPVLALVVSLLIIIAGLQALRTLNVRQYPRSENAVVTVTTVYVGASAELIRGFITTPIERALQAKFKAIRINLFREAMRDFALRMSAGQKSVSVCVGLWLFNQNPRITISAG